MQKFQVNPLAAQQQQQILERNKAIAAQGGGSGLGAGLGMLGSMLGGAVGTAMGGPLGGALGSSIGGSLAGKGDLSGVTPQSIAMGALTSGIGSAVGDGIKAGAEAGKSAATKLAGDAIQDTATGAIQNANAVTDIATGAISNPLDTVANSATDLTNSAAKTSWKDALGDNFLWKKDISEWANAPGMSGKDALFEKPNSIFEYAANKATSYFEEGGEVSTEMKPFELDNSTTSADPKKKGMSDLQKALMLMSPVYALAQGANPLATLGLGALAADQLACGGKVKH